MAVAMLNCKSVLVPLDADYQIDLDALRRAVTGRTRAIVTISPRFGPGGATPRGLGPGSPGGVGGGDGTKTVVAT